LAAVLAAGAASFPTAAARAQVYFQPYVQAYYWQSPAQPRPAQRGGGAFVSRREIAAILYDEGYRLVGPIDYRDDAIVAVGVDDYGRQMRFVIDPDDGDVIGARRLSRQAARSDPGDGVPRVEQPRIPRPQSRPRETSSPARRPHQSASPPPPGPELDLTRRQSSGAPAGSSQQPPGPRPTAPTQGSARPEGPPAPAAASVQPASPQPAGAPVAHGSAHRAIVPPPGAAQAVTTPPQSPPAAQPAPPAPPAAPVVGSTGAQAPSAPAPDAVKPVGG